VHAERPTAGGEVGETGMQLGQLCGHRGELVDDDDQSGERGNLLDGARSRGGEQALAVPQLCGEALDRAGNAGAVEIGDQPDAVRQTRQVAEARAALEVEEQEGQLGG